MNKQIRYGYLTETNSTNSCFILPVIQDVRFTSIGQIWIGYRQKMGDLIFLSYQGFKKTILGIIS
jgi:hypothetical protein